MEFRSKTIICDIDGTLTQHRGNLSKTLLEEPTTIDGTIQKINEWDRKGYRIILITGRKESMRQSTETELTKLGIFYDQLIMGVGGGPRHLINDMKQDGTITAFAHNLERDKGIGNLEI